MCITRQTRFRCGHGGPALLTRSCTYGFDYGRARCRDGRDDEDSDIFLHPDALCPGCRAARLGIVQPAGWRPLPLALAHRSSQHHSHHSHGSHGSSHDGESSRSSYTSSSTRSAAVAAASERRKGGLSGNFVRFVIGADDYESSDNSDNYHAHHYSSSRMRRPPKTTGWRYREAAVREQDAHREGARMRSLYSDRASGEEELLRTLLPRTDMLRKKSTTRSWY